MNRKLILPAGILLCASLLSAGFLIRQPEQESEQHVSILMRKIGHHVLLAAGDSTSRVMPVKQTDKNIYQISFESALTFEPDTLVKIVSDIMVRDGFRLPYVVSVIDRDSEEVIYGFQIGNKREDIIPCLGRNQPQGRYMLQVALLEREQASGGFVPSMSILAGGTLLAFGLIFFIPRSAIKKRDNEDESPHLVGIGAFGFQPDKGLLRHEGKVVELTVKESRVLAILARELNNTVLREKLNEIWADEGVITGRSLDVFVSKLRKRFANDPSIRIINVHGKGYRLEVGSGILQQSQSVRRLVA